MTLVYVPNIFGLGHSIEEIWRFQILDPKNAGKWKTIVLVTYVTWQKIFLYHFYGVKLALDIYEKKFQNFENWPIFDKKKTAKLQKILALFPTVNFFSKDA